MTAARHPIVCLLASLAVLLVVCILVIWLSGVSENLRDAVFMVLPPFLGQIADTKAVPPLVMAVWLLGLLASIACLSVITALVVGRFVRVHFRGGHVSTTTGQSGHVVICGWNPQGEAIANSLLASLYCQGVVVVAISERRPLSNDDVEFVAGDPTQDEALRRAGIERAKSAIVLADYRQDANDADARALLVALAVESLSPAVHTCVQLLNCENKQHFERAGVDEIICLDQIGGNLAAASAVYNGVSALVTELLTFNCGSEFYKIEGVSVDRLAGTTYVETARVLAGKHVALLGVETDSTPDVLAALKSEVIHRVGRSGDRIMMINPTVEYRIRRGDHLLCVAKGLDACHSV